MARLHSLLLVLCSCMFCLHRSEACVNYATVTIAKRRKRANDDGNRLESTRALRYYFFSCMTTLVPSRRYDWYSNVDFTVLESLWFLNAHESYCSLASGGENKECWQNEIANFLKVRGGSRRVLNAAQTCIGHFAEDIEADPPSNRYAGMRHKRSSHPSWRSNSPLLKIYSFASCLKDSMGSKEGGTSVNYINLSLFVDYETSNDGCDTRRGAYWKNGPHWPYRFLALTSPKSKLRKYIESCTLSVFPPPTFWTTWGRWNRCTSRCGTGTQTRKRTCRSGADPSEVSDQCPGFSSETIPCVGTVCSNANSQNVYSWGSWTDYSECSKTCGTGTQFRAKPCLFQGHKIYNQHCFHLGDRPLQTRSCKVRRC